MRHRIFAALRRGCVALIPAHLIMTLFSCKIAPYHVILSQMNHVLLEVNHGCDPPTSTLHGPPVYHSLPIPLHHPALPTVVSTWPLGPPKNKRSSADHVTMCPTADFDFNDFNFTAPAQTFTDAPPARTQGLPAPIQTTDLYSEPTSAASPSISTPVGEKRKAVGSPESYEDASRVAAEEDKRRRNTAASARFRVKKKQREQALERSAKDMADKVANFESRIATLETENKWLKSLITEKNDKNLDLPALWKKYNSEESSRKGSERKDGVGTKA